MTPEDWKLVQNVASRAYLDAIDAMACIEILERGNHLAVTKGINEAGAGRAATLIKHALFNRILFITMRAYDTVRKGDHHLKVAFNKLAGSNLIEKTGEREQRDIVSAQSLWDNALNDPKLAKLRHYRNKHAAHLSQPDPNIDTPIVIELFQFARLTASIAEKLANGAGVFTMTLQNQIDAYEDSADAFWSHWG